MGHRAGGRGHGPWGVLRVGGRTPGTAGPQVVDEPCRHCHDRRDADRWCGLRTGSGDGAAPDGCTYRPDPSGVGGQCLRRWNRGCLRRPEDPHPRTGGCHCPPSPGQDHRTGQDCCRYNCHHVRRRPRPCKGKGSGQLGNHTACHSGERRRCDAHLRDAGCPTAYRSQHCSFERRCCEPHDRCGGRGNCLRSPGTRGDPGHPACTPGSSNPAGAAGPAGASRAAWCTRGNRYARATGPTGAARSRGARYAGCADSPGGAHPPDAPCSAWCSRGNRHPCATGPGARGARNASAFAADRRSVRFGPVARCR